MLRTYGLLYIMTCVTYTKKIADKSVHQTSFCIIILFYQIANNYKQLMGRYIRNTVIMKKDNYFIDTQYLILFLHFFKYVWSK